MESSTIWIFVRASNTRFARGRKCKCAVVNFSATGFEQTASALAHAEPREEPREGKA